MCISELIISGKIEGYIFKLEHYHINTNEKENNLNIDNNITLNNKSNESSRVNSSHLNNKNFSTTILHNLKNNNSESINQEIELNFHIDKTFIPESTNIFMLDNKKMSYVMNPKNLTEIKAFVKDQAIKKIRTNKEENLQENSDDSQSESGSDSKSDTYNNSISEKSIQNIKNKINDEYYRVKLDTIKLLVYDFKKDALIEVDDSNNKISKIDSVKNEDYKSKEFQSKFGKNDKKTTITNSTTITQDKSSEKDLLDSYGKESILIKQIEYTLNKEDTQQTIVYMNWLTFILFLIFLALAVFFLIYFILSLQNIKENIHLIYESYLLILNLIYSQFHVRELIILNNPKYQNIYLENREDYTQNQSNALKVLFSFTHKIFIEIITSFLSMTKENSDKIFNSEIKTYILQDNKYKIEVFLPYETCYIEIFSSLFQISEKSTKNISSTSSDVYFFMYNSINSVYLNLFSNKDIFLNELEQNVLYYQLQFLYMFLVGILFTIISYFLIYNAYLAVSKRKESYLEVFFEIGENVIKNSLEKCENFMKKIQLDGKDLDDVSNLDQAEILEDKILSPVIRNSSKSIKSNKRFQKNRNSQENKVIKMKLIIGLCMINLLYFLVYFIYKNFLYDLQVYMDIYDNITKENAYYLLMFNILREYFYDQNTMVLENNIADYLDKEIDDIYKYKFARDNVKKNNFFFSNFQKNFYLFKFFYFLFIIILKFLVYVL